MTNFDINKYDNELNFLQPMKLFDFGHDVYFSPRPRMIFMDGFSISVQASNTCYCSPQTNSFINKLSKYDSYELGFPELNGEKYFDELIESYKEETGESAIYPYVPKKLLIDLIDKHGGINMSATFKGYQKD